MISSQLQSQLFSKVATREILTANNLVWGHRCPTSRTLDCFMMRSLSKANNIQARLIYTNIWEVEGSQRQFYNVHFSPFGARCHCMLFVCLANRIKKECPYFYQLMQQSSFFCGQVVCHHIAAALSYQGFHTLEQYISSKRKPHAA